jgi:DNA-binding transcriptional MerR regulator
MTVEPNQYSVKTIARLTGVPPATLRAWERRYGAIAPDRKASGHRLYGDADVERLRLLRQAVEAGHAIGQVAPLSDAALRRLTEAAPAAAPPVSGREALVARVLDALDDYDVEAAGEVLATAGALLPARRLVSELAVPLLHEVGARWANGRIGVAQEHLVSALMRDMLGTLVRLARPRTRSGGVLLATPAGERHELGLLLVALLAAARGLPVCNLGPDLPTAEIALAARRLAPAVVGLGITCVQDPSASLAAVQAIARALAPTEVWVGGHGALALPAEGWPANARRLAELPALEAALDGLAARHRAG